MFFNQTCFSIVDRILDVSMTECFDCHYCKASLFGKKYILREDSPYCIKCYESLYSNSCEECKKPIGCDCKVPWLNISLTSVLGQLSCTMYLSSRRYPKCRACWYHDLDQCSVTQLLQF